MAKSAQNNGDPAIPANAGSHTSGLNKARSSILFLAMYNPLTFRVRVY